MEALYWKTYWTRNPVSLGCGSGRAIFLDCRIVSIADGLVKACSVIWNAMQLHLAEDKSGRWETTWEKISSFGLLCGCGVNFKTTILILLYYRLMKIEKILQFFVPLQAGERVAIWLSLVKKSRFLLILQWQVPSQLKLQTYFVWKKLSKNKEWGTRVRPDFWWVLSVVRFRQSMSPSAWWMMMMPTTKEKHCSNRLVEYSYYCTK